MSEASLSKVINELKKDNPNLDKVQQLIIKYQDSTESDLVRFRVNGTLINRLGAELVEKKETAICELIKNSYDADSKEVTVDFINIPKREKLIITDLGNGMTRDQLVHGFMVIGTQNKLDEPISPVLKRKRAGSKGIGRIAAFRLGKTLTIETKSKNSKKGYRVKIDWTRFEDSDEITSVRFPIEEGDFVDKGTRLTIENLNDSWDKNLVQGVYKYVEDLLQPEVVSKELKVDADSFDVNFNIKTSNTEVESIQKKGKIIFDYAHAEIDSYVNSSGVHKINFISKPYDLNEKLNGDSKFSNLDGVYFKAYYFLHGKAGMVRGINKKKINYLLDQGRFGIRVYRNGFRVLPFGESDNDWLGLDQYEGKRKILVPLGNKNFFGFISIYDPEDKKFVETSNREGFVQNLIFEELVTFGLETCIKVGSKIGELRGKKIFAAQKDFRSGSGGSPKIKLIEIENQLTNLLTEEVSKNNSIIKNEEKVTEIHDQIKSHVKSAMTAIRQQYVEPADRYSSSLLEENSMLRILATLGISVGEFTHEMRLFVPALENDVDNLEDTIKEFAAKKILARMRQNINGLSNYIGFFDNTIIQNNDRTLESHDLSGIVKDFAERMDADFKKTGITFKLEMKGSNFLTIPMHYSEWTSILFNFYTNSKKAIKASNVNGNILVHLGKESNKISLEFYDNGTGISDSIKPHIFDAFVTSTKTSDLRRKKTNDISGSGLGLWIVRQILQNYGGEVKLAEPKKGYKTCFKILIPKK